MTNEIVLYTNPRSRGRIAHWMLEEVDAPYRTEFIELGAGTRTPEFLAINPMGKVPTLVHGAEVVTEAAAICAYLADTFPEAGLAPRPGERAAYYRWLFFAAGPLESSVTNRALGFTPPEERQGMVGYGSFEAVMDTIERALEAGPFVAGDRFTAADVYFGSQVGWGLMFGSIEARPAFKEYWGRLASRPALARANAANDAAMAAEAS
ncbi:glutathione S-transferase family protein [Amaricoccus sp.]|uniref:glutathione S-transferase family protein n=1 Tax=Amaricoccus sp. TaxID=1872485 RepID=UPI001B670D63|nr:glutathione S-transferase family protein [Amaricoccus sp.]MBP7240923.1 glutathione S-transferase family protein [Amaricoccus sp.]